jgi:hypothetical protein
MARNTPHTTTRIVRSPIASRETSRTRGSSGDHTRAIRIAISANRIDTDGDSAATRRSSQVADVPFATRERSARKNRTSTQPNTKPDTTITSVIAIGEPSTASIVDEATLRIGFDLSQIRERVQHPPSSSLL